MKSGRGGSRPAEKVVAAVAAKGEWDTSRPRVAYSSGKHKEEGNNSRESSTRKNIYGSVIPPCSKFFFFFGQPVLPVFFFYTQSASRWLTSSHSLFISPFPSLFRLYVRSFRFVSLFFSLENSYNQSLNWPFYGVRNSTTGGKYGIESGEETFPGTVWLFALVSHSCEIRVRYRKVKSLWE